MVGNALGNRTEENIEEEISVLHEDNPNIITYSKSSALCLYSGLPPNSLKFFNFSLSLVFLMGIKQIIFFCLVFILLSYLDTKL